MDKKRKLSKNPKFRLRFFATGYVFYRPGDWVDLQIDPHVSLHDGFKIQFAGIVPVVLELNAWNTADYCKQDGLPDLFIRPLTRTLFPNIGLSLASL